MKSARLPRATALAAILLLSVGLANADIPISPRPRPPTPAPVATHIVIAGDTLTSIAKTYAVTVTNLLAANPSVTLTSTLKIGQALKIPAVTQPAPLVPAPPPPAPSPPPAPADQRPAASVNAPALPGSR